MTSKNNLRIQLGDGIALTSSSDVCRLSHTFYVRQGNILTFEIGEQETDQHVLKYCRRTNKEYGCNRAIQIDLQDTTNDRVTELQLWFTEERKSEFERIKQELLDY